MLLYRAAGMIETQKAVTHTACVTAFWAFISATKIARFKLISLNLATNGLNETSMLLFLVCQKNIIFTSAK